MVDASSIAFWGILGGLSLLCVIIIVLVYFVCYSRNPRHCLPTENEELLETTIHREEIHTVSSETHLNGKNQAEPTVVHKTEQVCRVTTKQQCRTNAFKKSDPVKINVTSQTNPPVAMTPKSVSCSKGSGQSPRTQGSALGLTRSDSSCNTPRSGRSTLVTSIGAVS